MNYSVDLDYEVGNEVMLNGTKYRCLRENGPGTSLVTPGSNKAVWKNLDAPSVIAGQITPFANCRLGGRTSLDSVGRDSGRRAICVV